MGMLLVAISVQMVLDGVGTYLKLTPPTCDRQPLSRGARTGSRGAAEGVWLSCCVAELCHAAVTKWSYRVNLLLTSADAAWAMGTPSALQNRPHRVVPHVSSASFATSLPYRGLSDEPIPSSSPVQAQPWPRRRTRRSACLCAEHLGRCGGTVTDNGGQPVAGAEVTITTSNPSTVSRATTDASGRYSARTTCAWAVRTRSP